MTGLFTRFSAERAIINAAAYSLWEEHQRPRGREIEFWLEAEADLTAQNKIRDRPLSLPLIFIFRVGLAEGHHEPPSILSQMRETEEALDRIGKVVKVAHECVADARRENIPGPLPKFLRWKDAENYRAGVEMTAECAHALMTPPAHLSMIACIDKHQLSRRTGGLYFNVLEHTVTGERNRTNAYTHTSLLNALQHGQLVTKAQVEVLSPMASFALNLLRRSEPIIIYVRRGFERQTIDARFETELARAAALPLQGWAYLLGSVLEDANTAIARWDRVSHKNRRPRSQPS